VLGSSAYGFIDFLSEAGIKYWQILPLGPTGFGDSPYSSLSAFAGNPYLIDLVPLTENGILQAIDLEALHRLPADQVDFQSLNRIKWPLLRLAHKRFIAQKRTYLPNYGMLDEFKRKHKNWLESYCAYVALKDRFRGKFWGEWPEECRTLKAARKSKYWQETSQAREAHAFFQYIFFGQWQQLRKYANAAGIEIVGDVPIYVALDSADTWLNSGLFEMKVPGQPDYVAGVPPDYFSETGQLWGNPQYNWKAMAKDGYAWWMDRMAANFELYDVVRLDHFRAFYDYWNIPANAIDARSGKWAQGPKQAFFKELKKRLPEAKLIAEDLGELHDKLRNFRDRLGLPGMAILHFAFDDNSENTYLPHNVVPNSVIYPGTHDNNTTRGWYESAPAIVQDHVRRYFRVDGSDIAWDMIRWAYQSPSNLVIVAMQDLMSLGEKGRMNMPGTSQGNWKWRMTGAEFQSQRECAPYLKDLAELYGR
jgi:4-alpha-glucanotransferase